MKIHLDSSNYRKGKQILQAIVGIRANCMMCTERLPIVKKNLCMVLNECHFYVDVTCQMH